MTQPLFHAPTGRVLALLRFENVALASAAVVAFHALGGDWRMFAALFLLPDLSMLGYLRGPTAGARLYNLAHTYLAPAAPAAIGWIGGEVWWLHIALIWCAHIGIDRALGFGLKYRDGFAATHLGRLRRPA